MKNKNIIASPFLLALLLVLLAGACKKQDENLDREIPGLGGDTWANTPLDNWILETFTKPYNFQVKYKWDRFELEPTRTMVPPKEEKVIPVMSLVKELWMDAYIEIAGKTFFNTYSPKEYVLVGSYEYNSNGTVKEGSAEGGRKITLYNLNTFTATNKPVAKRMIHVIQHEFGHILHQNKMYPAGFRSVTPGDYTSDWNNRREGFQEKGIITQYAQSNADDDFVELIAFMLTEGKEAYEALLASPGIPATAVAKFRQKENYIVEYFKNSWNIDFYELQALMTAKSNAYFDNTTLKQLLDEKVVTMLTVLPNETNQSAAFNAAFTTAQNLLLNLSTAKYKIAKLEYSFITPESVILTVYFSAEATPNNFLLATYLYTFQTNADGTMELINLSFPDNSIPSQNAAGIYPALYPIVDFIDGIKLKLDFAPGTGFSNLNLTGGYYNDDNPVYFLKGTFDQNYDDNI